jgi:hypothetical protein
MLLPISRTGVPNQKGQRVAPLKRSQARDSSSTALCNVSLPNLGYSVARGINDIRHSRMER